MSGCSWALPAFHHFALARLSYLALVDEGELILTQLDVLGWVGGGGGSSPFLKTRGEGDRVKRVGGRDWEERRERAMSGM